MSNRTFKELVSTLQDVKNKSTEITWDLPLLVDCLEIALNIEFSTIPPYLCAFWSIKDRNDPAYKAIREQIAQEEMIHMGLVFNLLVALGQKPSLISNPAVFPGTLPGDLAENKTIYLQGYSMGDATAALETFLAIEYPQNGPIEIADDAAIGLRFLAMDNEVINSAKTIGEFYDSIFEGFEILEQSGELPQLQTDRQLELDVGQRGEENTVFVIGSINGENSVKQAIDLIKRQGEGSSESGSPGDESNSDLAHYYLYLEFQKERKIRETGPGSAEFEFSNDPADALPFPEPDSLWPMAKIPAPEGYPDVEEGSEVYNRMEEFDIKYTEMLLQLDAAWNSDYTQEEGQRYLDAAVGTMLLRKNIALDIMAMPIPGNAEGEHYGPCFRVNDTATLPPLPDGGGGEVVENPTWEIDIKVLFTPTDIACMKNNGSQFDLSNYDDVARKADDILAAVSSGFMPTGNDRNWPPEWVTTFENWINTGKPEFPTWEANIKGLFTEADIACMSGFGVNLNDYENVKANATIILDRVSRDEGAGGVMPPQSANRHWPQNWIDTFRYWSENGMPEG